MVKYWNLQGYLKLSFLLPDDLKLAELTFGPSIPTSMPDGKDAGAPSDGGVGHPIAHARSAW